MIFALGAAIIFVLSTLIITGFNWVGLIVLVAVTAALFLFFQLNVRITEDLIELRFGTGLIRKKIYLEEIESSQTVKNRWYWGWGLRMTAHGPLYNVSGFQAVEVRLKNGSRVRIGTDVPQELQAAIQAATSVQKKLK
jgi:hypothetical protein